MVPARAFDAEVMGIRRGSISTPIIADGLILNMDAANRASYPAQRTFATAESGSCYNTLDLSQSGSFIADPQFITQPISASCWDFDGIDDYIKVSTNNFSNVSTWTQNCTYDIWFKSSDTSVQHIFGYGNGSTTEVLVFDLNQSNAIWIYWDGGGSNHLKWGSSGELCDGTVKNIQYTANDGDNKFYVNGIEQTPSSLSGTQTISVGGTDFSLIYGATTLSYYPIWGMFAFNGVIYNTKLYNRALSANEVLHNYNALKGRFA